jgi:hypothetical protein
MLLKIVQCVHFGAEEDWFVISGGAVLLALGFAEFVHCGHISQ